MNISKVNSASTKSPIIFFFPGTACVCNGLVWLRHCLCLVTMSSYLTEKNLKWIHEGSPPGRAEKITLEFKILKPKKLYNPWTPTGVGYNEIPTTGWTSYIKSSNSWQAAIKEISLGKLWPVLYWSTLDYSHVIAVI